MMQGANTKARPRGGALLLLFGVVFVWSAMRMMTWVPPFLPSSLMPQGDSPFAMEIERSAPVMQPAESPVPSVSQPAMDQLLPAVPDWQLRPSPQPILPPKPFIPAVESYPPMHSGAASRGFAGAGRLIGHAMLLQAGYRESAAAPTGLYSGNALTRADANMPVPPIPTAAAAAELRRDPAPSRWSMDAWALWRQDTTTPFVSGRPSYGRSQIGAVARYRLAPSNGHAPELHLRGSAAVDGAREREFAFGASVRPVPSVPVRLASEARVSETRGGTELRGAAYAVSEIPPVALPAGFSAEVYGQAGYVTGDAATPFIDGQARITRELASVDDFRIEAGGGAWGGAQDDAARLDVGPSASVSFRIGPARGRVSADYRFRVAGDAEPSSGPALTLSAGF